MEEAEEMLHTHTQHTPREREVPRGRKFAEKLNALVKSAHAFSPSPLLLLFSLGAQMSMRIASLFFSCRLPLSPPRWTPDQAISTTGVLNATTLIYARRAGITAAAGTRLALFLHSA